MIYFGFPNRLATESRELTLDWVATLTEKLRERGVFRPKENEYTLEPIKGSVTTSNAQNVVAQMNGTSTRDASVGSSRMASVGAQRGTAPQTVHPRRNMPLPPPPTEEAAFRCFNERSNEYTTENHYRPPSAAEMQVR